MDRKSILVPLTKSKISHRILPQLVKLIPAQGSKIILFYVTKPPRGMGFATPDYRSDYVLRAAGEPLGPKPTPVFTTQQEDSIQAEVEVTLLPTINDLKRRGYEVSLQVCFVDAVVSEIVRVIKREKIDLLAMSTNARVGMRSFFFGDIARKVMQQVEVPVMLIHPKE